MPTVARGGTGSSAPEDLPVDSRPPARTRQARRLFADVAESYDAMSEVLSFGQNRRWRRFLVSKVPARPDARILDVATGTAAVALDLARRGARVVGLDQSPEMLGIGRRRVRRGNARVGLVQGQAERLPFGDSAFDAVTFTYLLRYVDDPAATLAELARVTRPGGVVASLEFHVPDNIVWRWGWFAHTRLGLPLLGGVASAGWYRAARFLGPSISAFYRRAPLESQLRMWAAAGIGGLRVRRMTLGAGVVVWGVRDAG